MHSIYTRKWKCFVKYVSCCDIWQTHTSHYLLNVFAFVPDGKKVSELYMLCPSVYHIHVTCWSPLATCNTLGYTCVHITCVCVH